LGDIVDDLKAHMRLDGVLASDRLIFVCHSMGGIVVRMYIVERQAELIEAGKEMDLFLVAFPLLRFDLCGLAVSISTRRPTPCVLCATITG
jgi:hypothetical protein